MRAGSINTTVVLLTILLHASAASAAGIRASVDRKEARLGDHLRLTLTIEGSATATPVLPALEEFDVYSQGQSTQMRIVNGRMSTTANHNYVLVPKRPGIVQIGAASVEIGGKVYTTRPFTVRIIGEHAAPQKSRDLYLTARVSTKTPFVGEQIIYTFRMYQRVQLARANLEGSEFEGFVTHDLGDQRTFDTTVRGVEYRVTEIRKALFPQEAGTLTIPPAKIQAEVILQSRQRRRGSFDSFFDSPFDDFFGRRQTETRTLTTAPITVEVSRLPATPTGYSGLVGRFAIQASLSRERLKVGESTTLTVTVSGRGNAGSIPQPSFGDLSQFKVYDDKPSSTVNMRNDGVSGSKTFRKALVPLAAGTIAIPAIRLITFDPAAKLYRTITTKPLSVVAEPSEGKEELRLTELVSLSTGKVAVRILADDILPIYRRLDAISADRIGGADRIVFGGGLTVPALGFIGLFVVRRRREQLQGDIALRRRRGARRKARQAMREIGKKARTGSVVGAAETASRVLREFIGDMLNLEGGALTPGETAEHLRCAGVPTEIIAEIEGLLDRCDEARYGGAVGDLAALPGAARDLLDRLDRKLGG